MQIVSLQGEGALGADGPRAEAARHLQGVTVCVMNSYMFNISIAKL